MYNLSYELKINSLSNKTPLPAVQGVKVWPSCPSESQYFPAGHKSQEFKDFPPVSERYRPMGHFCAAWNVTELSIGNFCTVWNVTELSQWTLLCGLKRDGIITVNTSVRSESWRNFQSEKFCAVWIVKEFPKWSLLCGLKPDRIFKVSTSVKTLAQWQYCCDKHPCGYLS